MSAQSIPYVLLLGTMFGTSLVASRFSVGQFMPSTYIGLRLVLSTMGFAAVYMLRIGNRTLPRGRQLWKHSSILGIFGTAIPMLGIVGSLQYLSSGLASILITVNPAITVLLAHFFLTDERLTPKKITGARRPRPCRRQPRDRRRSIPNRGTTAGSPGAKGDGTKRPKSGCGPQP